jgi:plastocyanin
MYLTSSDLELGGADGTTPQITGIRFSNLNLPINAHITIAYVQFTCDEAFPQSANMQIRTQTGNAAAFTASPFNLSTRPLLPTSVSWTPAAWTVVGERGTKQRTPNLADLLNENLATGWQTGQSMLFRFDGNAGPIIAVSREGNVNNAAQLTIVYEIKTTAITSAVIEDPAQMDSLKINEVAAQGSTENAEDWIELYNAHTRPILIKDGVYLSDKAANLSKFELKNITIPAKSYFIITAKGDSTLGNIGANFKIGNDAETIHLSRKINNIITLSDQLASSQTFVGESYGRLPNGFGSIVKFTKVSYNRSNTEGGKDVPVGFSQKRGFYTAPFNLALTAPAGATIRYTLDGTFPTTTNGIIYSAPIPINKTTVVKTIGFEAGGQSRIQTHTYLFENNRINEPWKYPTLITDAEYAAGMKEVPVISLSSSNALNTDIEQLGTFEYIELPSANKEGFAIEAGFDRFGESTLTYPKNNINIAFKKIYSSGSIDYDIFSKGATDSYKPKKISRLELKEGQDGVQFDDLGNARYSEHLMRTTLREMGNFDPYTKFVNVYLNGKFHGLYTLREQFDDNLGENYFGGNDIDYDRIDAKYTDWNAGVPHVGNLTNWDNMRSAAQAGNFQKVKTLLEVSDYINMMVFYLGTDNEWEALAIGHRANTFSKLRMTLNDSDGLLEEVYSVYPLHWENEPEFQQFNGPGGIWGNLYNSGNLEFKTMVKDRVLQHYETLGGALTVDRMRQKVTDMSKQINISYKLDVARWGYDPTLYDVWKTHTEYVKQQLVPRYADVISRFAQKGLRHTLVPAPFTPASGNITVGQKVSFSNSNAGTTVYYTTDGTDPMDNDGVVSANAKAYNATTQIALPVGTYKFVARAFATGNWGPKSNAAITVVAAAVASISAQATFIATGHQKDKTAVIEWVVNDKINADYFIVERFNNDMGVFEKLETINVNPNKNAINHYVFTDNSPFLDKNLYRVGLFEGGLIPPQYAQPITLDFSHFIDYALYPNPAQNNVALDLSIAKNQAATIYITNILGKEVKHMTVENAPSTLFINLENFEHGQYFMHIQVKGKKLVTKKLVVMK